MLTVRPNEKVRPVSKQVKAAAFKETPVSLISLYILAIPVFLFYILPLPFSLQLATAGKYSVKEILD